MTFPFPTFSPVAFINPVTAYANAGGNGDRTASITVTIFGFAWDGGPNSNLVDGAVGSNTTDSCDEPADGTSANGNYLDFDFGSGVYKFIDEITLEHGVSSTHGGDWMFQGSRDGSTFENLATAVFSWPAGTSTVVTLDQPNGTSNQPGWRYIRLLGGATSQWSNNWFKEVTFKIGGTE
jgi:hypothetical protein